MDIKEPSLVLFFPVEIRMVIIAPLTSKCLDGHKGNHVPKLINVHHPQQAMQQAQVYIKTHVLLPSGLLGLLCMIGAIGGLGYQWFAINDYSLSTFYQSFVLFISGVGLGALQTLYQRYLLREFPEVLAARMKEGLNRQRGTLKKRSDATTIDHPGRQFIPLAYVLGAMILIGETIVAAAHGQVSLVPALLMPWAGFYWIRLFLWRRVIKVEKGGAVKS
ncbi:MAG: hypothetical protein CV081_01960 [Nitrospira sp. LK265]|nr:hypothetical protein [Nitrospira sp. LK265]